MLEALLLHHPEAVGVARLSDRRTPLHLLCRAAVVAPGAVFGEPSSADDDDDDDEDEEEEEDQAVAIFRPTPRLVAALLEAAPAAGASRDQDGRTALDYLPPDDRRFPEISALFDAAKAKAAAPTPRLDTPPTSPSRVRTPPLSPPNGASPRRSPQKARRRPSQNAQFDENTSIPVKLPRSPVHATIVDYGARGIPGCRDRKVSFDGPLLEDLPIEAPLFSEASSSEPSPVKSPTARAPGMARRSAAATTASSPVSPAAEPPPPPPVSSQPPPPVSSPPPPPVSSPPGSPPAPVARASEPPLPPVSPPPPPVSPTIADTPELPPRGGAPSSPENVERFTDDGTVAEVAWPPPRRNVVLRVLFWVLWPFRRG